MAVQTNLNNTNVAFERAGEGRIFDNETFEQDAGRSTELAIYTVVAQKAATKKWVPLTSVDPTLVKASLLCGALGTNLAGFQAITDGEFQVPVDGVTYVITGLDFSSIAALHEIPDTINSAAGGAFNVVYDSKTTKLTFYSPTVGDGSTMEYLAAVPGGTGTDISGAGFLNGLTGTGVLTQGSGSNGANLPTGIVKQAIPAADLAAADVTGIPVLLGGNVVVDENQIVLEGSLTLDSVVVALSKTIEQALGDRGIWMSDTIDISSHQA
jgi:hypothetical protein